MHHTSFAAAATRDDTTPDWFHRALAYRAESHRADVNGNRLHYLAWNAERRDRPLLLFVHGFRAHARWWDFIAPFFTASHQVIALDLSGMGDSGWRDGYSAEQLAGDVTGLIEALDLGPATVVAHSYGGLCTLRAAAARGDLFTRIVTLDTFVLFEDTVIPDSASRISGARTYPDYDSARLRYRLLPPQPQPLACTVEHVARHSLCPADGGLRWKFDPRLQEPSAHARDGDALLRRVATPVDYVYGERSALIDVTQAQRITAALRHGRGPIAIPGGHHHLMLDQPLALIAGLRGLLAAIHRPSSKKS
jgi:pimeloyl-ACP methyl ester carboxylesterase